MSDLPTRPLALGHDATPEQWAQILDTLDATARDALRREEDPDRKIELAETIAYVTLSRFQLTGVGERIFTLSED